MNFLRSVLFEDDDEEDEEEEDIVSEKGATTAEEKIPLKSAEDVDEKDSEIQEEKKESMTSEIQEDGTKDEENGEDTIVESPTEGGVFGALGKWNLGAIVKNIKEKSEEIFNEYKEELQEFGDGLRKETEELVEITGHKVKDLPASLETGATVAQESLEEVGQTIEEIGNSLWQGTKEIISHVKEAVALVEEEAALNSRGKPSTQAYVASLQRGKYSRYEALVSAMQRDSSTYCDEPEDTVDFNSWKGKFNLEDKKQDIDDILKENAFMQELQSRIVPVIVEFDVFWTRYFYRLHKLQQAEDARADLVKRATNTAEEELSWDVDDDMEGSTTQKEKDDTKDEKQEAVKEAEIEKLDAGKEAEEKTDKKDSEIAAIEDLLEEKSSEIKEDSVVKKPPKEDETGSDSNSSSGDWQVVGKGSPKEDLEKSEKLEDLVPIKEEKAEEKSDEVKDVKVAGKSKEDDEDWSEWE